MYQFSTKKSTVSLTQLPVSILECPVCRDVPVRRKIFQCKNGHIICEICNSRLLSSTTCPTCRVPITDQIRNRAVEETLHFIETPCLYNKRGCSARLPKGDLMGHLKECFYRPVFLCRMLGFSDCNFDASNADDVIDHLATVHNIPRKTGDFLSLEFPYVSSSVEPGELEVVKIFGSQLFHRRITSSLETKNASTLHHHHHHSSFSFLFLLKQDEISSGMLAVCLFLGPSLQDSTNFRTAYYFTSTNVPKCVASWPVVWYKDPVVTNDDCSIWDWAYHISFHTLKVIQGQDEMINLLVRIRDIESSPTILG